MITTEEPLGTWPARNLSLVSFFQLKNGTDNFLLRCPIRVSLLDQSAQVEGLKNHLINVGGKRRITNSLYDRSLDTTFDDLSFLSD